MNHDQPHETITRNSDPDPASPHHAPVKSADEARSGVETGHMRWVLRISMILVAAAFLIAWAIAR